MMLVFDDAVPRAGGFALLAAFITYIVALVWQASKSSGGEDDDAENNEVPKPLSSSVCFAVLGASLIVAGGGITVTSAVSIALALGVTERVIGLTIVAIGTSLPEFVTSLVACKKGENAIAIGDVIGSNIFNITFVLGLSGLIMPLAIDRNLFLDVCVLIIGSLAVLPLAFTGRRIVRLEGLLMVLMYAAYMVYVMK